MTLTYYFYFILFKFVISGQDVTQRMKIINLEKFVFILEKWVKILILVVSCACVLT